MDKKYTTSKEAEAAVFNLVQEYFSSKKSKVLNLSELTYNEVKNFDTYLVSKSVAATLKETGDFEIETEGIADGTIYFVKRATTSHWSTRHPFLFAVIIAFIGAALALGGDWLLSKKEGQAQTQRDSQQDSTLKSLSDSLANLQTEIRALQPDTTKKPQ